MKLAEYMKENRLVDAAFAEIAGVSQSTVLRWRKGEMLPAWDAMIRIESATSGAVMPNDFMPERAENG